MTPEELVKRRRLNRKLLMFGFGPVGLFWMWLAINGGAWWAWLAAGVFLFFAIGAWRMDPDNLPYAKPPKAE